MKLLIRAVRSPVLSSLWPIIILVLFSLYCSTLPVSLSLPSLWAEKLKHVLKPWNHRNVLGCVLWILHFVSTPASDTYSSQNKYAFSNWNSFGVNIMKLNYHSMSPKKFLGKVYSLVTQDFGQRDTFGVVFGYLPNNHSRNCLILVISGNFAMAIVFLSLHIDDKTTIALWKWPKLTNFK